MNAVDFLPQRIRQRRARRRRLLRQGYLLGACVLAMGGLTYVRHGRIAEAKGELTALEQRLNNVRRQVDMIESLQGQMADLLIKKRIDEELGSRTDCTAVLAELCRVTPPDTALTRLDLKTVEIQPKEADRPAGAPAAARAVAASPREADRTTRRVRLVVTGLAPTDVDVANFIGQLSASPLFQDVNMGYAKTVLVAGRTGREFQASCYLVK